MAVDADVIKEFLVKLGYKIDESSQRKFTDQIAAVTLKVVSLGVAVEAAATAVVLGVARMAESLERLHFMSVRTNATVEGIQAIGFAASQMGGSVDGARASIEGLASFLRSSPGAASYLRSLGVDTAQTVDNQLTQLGERFRQMPFYLAKARASVLGIDERTLMVLIDGVGEFGKTYSNMLKKAGVDSQQAAKDSHAFMVELRTLWAAVEIIWIKVSSTLTKRMSVEIQRLRTLFVDNFDKIVDVIEKVAEGLLYAADVVTKLVITIVKTINEGVEWFKTLDETTQFWIRTLGLVLIAWKVLSLAIMSNPLGFAIAALITALALLKEDYDVWKAGGESLIDWGKWEPGIKSALKGMEDIGTALKELITLVSGSKGLQWALEALALYIGTKWIFAVLGPFGKVILALTLIAALLKEAISTGDIATNEKEREQNPGLGPQKGYRPLTPEEEKKLQEERGGGAKEFWGNVKKFLGISADEQVKSNDILKDIASDSSKMVDLLGPNSPLWPQMGLPGAVGGAGSGWRTGDAPGSDPALQDRANRLVKNLMRDLGLTEQQAYGIAGAGAVESGILPINEKNPAIPGSRGGFGIWQHTGSRRDPLEAFIRAHPEMTVHEANYQFFVEDMKKNYPHLLSAIKQTNRAGPAAVAFSPYETGNYGPLLGNVPKYARAAERLAGGGAGQGATVTQTNNITLNGIQGHPNDFSDALARVQQDPSRWVGRNVGTAVR